ncbi:hypothetical protein ABGB08_27980, partial [Acrocarpospora sp. B8E8]
GAPASPPPPTSGPRTSSTRPDHEPAEQGRQTHSTGLAAHSHDTSYCSLAASTQFTAGHHDQLGLAIPREKIPALIALYGGALFTLVTAPPESVSRNVVQGVVHAIVYGSAVRGRHGREEAR